MTLVPACHDVLRVVSAQERSDYEDGVESVIENADDPPQPMGEVRANELSAYQGMEYDHRYVVHDDEYVSNDGLHTHQVECLWSLVQLWMTKFRSLSK